MIQPSSFLNNYTEEAFKDFRTRVLLDSGFFESEEGSKQNFAYNLPTLTTNLDSDTQEFLKATGIKDHSIISHINNYVVKLKRFGLWSKIKALYPFVSDQRNVLRNTDTFGSWSLEGGTITGNFTDPLGGATAYKYTAVGTAGLWTGSPTMFISSSTKVTYSFWIRSVSGNNMTAVLTDAYNVGPSYTINITGTWTYITATLTLTSGNAGMYINNLSDPTNGFLIWRPQMEVGSVATTYQPTTSPSTIYTNHFKYNLKDPRDLDAAFRLTFSGGWQFSQLGATPNGTNAYADTKLNPSSQLTANNHHISLYSRTNSSADSIDSGITDNIAYSFFQLQLPRFGSLTIQNGSQIVDTTFTNSLGLFIGTSTSTTLTKLYQNGGVIGTSTTLQTRALFNNNIYIGTSNVSTNNNPVGVYSAKQYAFGSIGDGLTDSEATNLYYLTEELQANLKRNVSPYNSFRGILDEYPGAAAAYSLRRLSGSYGGPLVKVRRSSDNTEQDIFPTASGSLDTTSLLSFVGAGNGFVTTWYDQSGNSVNATQTTAANQPQIVSAGSVILKNSKPSVNFDGSNDFFSLSSSIATSTNYSFFTAAYNESNATGDTYMSGSSGSAQFINDLSGSQGKMYIIKTYVTEIIGGNISKDRFNLNTFFTHNSANSLYTNGSLSNSNTLTPNFTNPITTIGRNNAGSIEYYLNGISEMILYSSNQASNRTGIESNINTYYNLFWDGSRKGLLDFYPNAAAAYSVRALSSSYRGPLLRVRRASDNTETDIFALQNGNLDTFTLGTFCSGTDGFVTTWYDQSGLGKNATQSTAGSQPQIVSSGSVLTENTKPSIRFNNHYMIISSVLLNNTNISVYYATLAKTTYSYGGILTNKRSYLDDANAINWLNNGKVQTVFNSSVNSEVIQTNVATTLFQGTSLWNTTNVTFRTNGTQDATALKSGTQNFSTQTWMGSYRQDTNNLGNFTIPELIVYQSDQSSNNNAIENNIKTYYGI